MLVEDRIYGNFEIDSPILVELINSPAVQRLKGINQYGVPDEFYHLKNFSRFEHSLGVMLLLKLLNASEEEQIAGLLHDASHTAFSHVVDFVVGTSFAENYQDDNHLARLKKTNLSDILTRYGYDLERIADHRHFGLLERSIPDLCADRVDYALREFPEDVAKTCLAGLTVKDGSIVFNNQAAAKLFAKNFLERQQVNWGSAEAVNRYHYFAEVLKRAIDLGCISFDDLEQDDAYVTEKIKQCNDGRIKQIFNTLRNKSLSDMPKGNMFSAKKFRHVDPLFWDGSELRRLSKVNEEFGKLLKAARAKNDAGVSLVVI